jgi:hypothetical protein
MLKNVLAISVALLLFGSNAVAQGAARACVADIKKGCAGVEPGEGRIAVASRSTSLISPHRVRIC